VIADVEYSPTLEVSSQAKPTVKCLREQNRGGVRNTGRWSSRKLIEVSHGGEKEV
jgi:hypothetical protein